MGSPLVLLAAASCTATPIEATGESAAAINGRATTTLAFTAVLSGASEVPPVDTRGAGQASFTLRASKGHDDESRRSSLSYSVSTTGLSGIRSIELRQGAVGQEGPVVAVLRSGGHDDEGEGDGDGRRGHGDRGDRSDDHGDRGDDHGGAATISGSLTEADLRGPLKHDWSGFAAALSAGTIYVNVTTRAHPSGELRGQVLSGVATGNQAPDATITAPSANVTIAPGASVSFAGTASDPDGDAVTVLWSFGDGSTSTLLTPGAHVYAAAGVYQVSLTATDSLGLVDPTPATRTVTAQTATPNNQPPDAIITAPAANVTITPGASVDFAATTSDPNGDAVTVLWSFGDGSTSTLLTPGAHVYAAAGVYQVSLTATDALGAVDPTPATRTITVQTTTPTNRPPDATITAPAANLTVTLGQAVTFAGTATDPDGNPVTVLWSFGDGSNSTALSPGAHSYGAVGVFTVTLTATDSLGLADPTPATRVVTVTAVTANAPPVGVITAPTGNVTIVAGQSVSFSGTATDPNGNPVTVVWTFGDGATSTLLAPGAHAYAAAGTYTARLTATDSLGLADPAPPTRTITVTPVVAPAPTLTQIQTTLFTPSCTGCHSAGGDAGLNLSAGAAYGNLVNIAATTLPGNRVVPGSPSTSALVTQLAGGHRSVSAANQAMISDWITAGALNN